MFSEEQNTDVHEYVSKSKHLCTIYMPVLAQRWCLEYIYATNGGLLYIHYFFQTKVIVFLIRCSIGDSFFRKLELRFNNNFYNITQYKKVF